MKWVALRHGDSKIILNLDEVIAIVSIGEGRSRVSFKTGESVDFGIDYSLFEDVLGLDMTEFPEGE